MVSAMRVNLPLAVTALAFVGMALTLMTGALAQDVTDDSLVCANSERDWNRIGNTASVEAARAFLRDRVMEECSALSERVRGRISNLEAEKKALLPTTTVAPLRKETRTPRVSAETDKARRIQTPSPLLPAQPKRPHFSRDPAAGADLDWWQPNWFQVLARYPDLERLYDLGGADLCAACLVGASGFLEDCHIAGTAAADPAIRNGAKRMISMIKITKRDGSPATGTPVGVPVHFGRLLPPPPDGYCSNPERAFRH